MYQMGLLQLKMFSIVPRLLNVDRAWKCLASPFEIFHSIEARITDRCIFGLHHSNVHTLMFHIRYQNSQIATDNYYSSDDKPGDI